MAIDLGLSIYVSIPESSTPTEPVDWSDSESPEVTTAFLCLRMIQSLVEVYIGDPAFPFSQRPPYDPQGIRDALLEAVEYGGNPGPLAGVHEDTFAGYSIFIAMWQRKPLHVDSQDPQVRERFNAIFALELGWVVKRMQMMLPREGAQSDVSIDYDALVKDAVQEFRYYQTQANALLHSVLHSPLSSRSLHREVMLHYECMMHKMVHFPEKLRNEY
ncbi:MAG: hypothetical protein HQM04_17235 [Magnetococcales bacterium]|nr:hypothetical protein [Magnetococcales bacterium]MBF0116776.1 hypothetical protein [Magnetococcales bacterium]